MPLSEPGWWYRREASLLAQLLTPVGAAYGWVTQRRFERAKPYRSRLPVICVGNFTAGGTGKTPLALHLCRHLTQTGQYPVALTRGHGGSLAGPYWIDASRDSAREVGDEPLLLAAHTRVLLARDRAAGARAIENGPHTATVIVMDDGLQNPALVKDFVIAVVDGERGFGNGRMIPAGPLRAPLEFQLDLADAILVNEPAGADGAIAEWLRHRFAGPVLRASAEFADDVAWLQGHRVLAWAGIGAPQRFFRMLEQSGAVLRGQVPFPDHHPLTAEQAAALLVASDQQGAQLVTTEKDLARLTRSTGPAAELQRRSRAMPIRVALHGSDADRLGELVASALHNRRS